MERLTKRITQYTIELSASANPIQYNGSSQRVHIKHPFWNVFDRLCKYEDAEENGMLIHLPCRVGDTAYFPQETNGECEPYVDVGTVFAIGLDERHTMWISVRYESGLKFYHTSDDIGKTVFLTREEAEQALAKMKGV